MKYSHDRSSKRFIFEICIHRLTLSVPVRTFVNFVWVGGTHRSQNCNPVELEANSQYHRINQKLVLHQSFNTNSNGGKYATVYEPRLTKLKVVEADKYSKQNVLAECIIDLSEFLEAQNDGIISIPLGNSNDPNAAIRVSVNVTAFLKGDDEAVSVSSVLSTISEFPGDLQSEHKWDPNASVSRTCMLHEYGSEDIYKTINRMATKLSKVEREIQSKTIKLSKVNRQNMDEINGMKAKLELQIAQKDRQIKILVNQLDEMHTALAISHQRELELGGAINEVDDDESVDNRNVKYVKKVKATSMDNGEFITTKRYESVVHNDSGKYIPVYPSKSHGNSRSYVPMRSHSREYFHHSIDNSDEYAEPDTLCSKVKQLAIPDDDKEYYINQNNKLKDAIRELESELKYKGSTITKEPTTRLVSGNGPRSYSREESYVHVESKNCDSNIGPFVDTPLHMRPYGSRIGSSKPFESVYNRIPTGYPKSGVSLNDRSSLPRDANSCFGNSARSNNLNGPGKYVNYKSVTKQYSATNMVNPRDPNPPQFHVRRVIGYSKPHPGTDHFFPVQTNVNTPSCIGMPISKNARTEDLETKIIGLEKELATTKVALADSETKREEDKNVFTKKLSSVK